MDDMDRNDYLQLADWRRRTAEIYARWREDSVLEPEAATLRLRSARGDLFHEHPQSPLPPEGRSRFSGLSYWAYDPAYRMRAFLEPGDSEVSGAESDLPGAGGQTADADDAVEPAPSGFAPPALASPSPTGTFSLSTAYRTAAAMPGIHWPTSLRETATTRVPDLPQIQLPASGDEPFAFKRIGRVRLSGPLAGESLSVFWMEGYAGGLFVPFRDATSGAETYGAGRYLLDTAKGADLGGDHASGELLLDFNLAFHPSCVYDSRWNCPLSPAENTLGEAVRVGERLG
jgi:uncharacterized protein (DUF1684 family)